MAALRIAPPTPRLVRQECTKGSAPLFARHSAIRCGGRDRNRRRGHSRSLERQHANHGSTANHLNAPTNPLREVLADDFYRGQRANVQKIEQTGSTSPLLIQ